MGKVSSRIKAPGGMILLIGRGGGDAKALKTRGRTHGEAGKDGDSAEIVS